MNYLALLFRLLLGGAFVMAGLGKILDPLEFADIIAGYGILHPQLVTLVALVLPWLELITGLCLILGFLTESSALILGLLSLGFGGAVAYVLTRGLLIPCGCFGGDSLVSGMHLLLDGGLALAAGVILYWGPGILALDRALATPVTRDANSEEQPD